MKLKMVKTKDRIATKLYYFWKLMGS